jgi:hypothetical protein
MPLIENGDPLETPIIQASWNINGDGYGLITSTTRYKCDHTVDLQEFVERGQPHPDAAYTFLKVNKYSISWDALGIATVTMDYAGIDPSFNDGNFTDPNCSGANGLTAQSITSHVNFFTAHPDFSDVIAGPAPYTQDTPNNLAPNVNNQPAFLGQNGACFEKASGGRFIGFVDPAFPSLYGKTQYLAPTTVTSGIIYAKTKESVELLVSSVGSTSIDTDWGTVTLLPSWAPIGAGDYGNMNLLSQVNVEEYASIFKVMYEIRYTIEGWDSKVYKEIS